jgi:histidine decarboxylase
MIREAARILPACVGTQEHYCTAAGFHPSDAYIAAPLISFGTAPLLFSPNLARIVAFDKAEARSGNITQTNLIQVSSFNGLNGLLLGYDLLAGAFRPCEFLPNAPNVFSAEPLFATTKALLGTIEDQRFPVAPGQHLLCAYKTCYAEGPCHFYAAMAIAIPRDRSRNADLFMEDLGVLESTEDPEPKCVEVAKGLMQSVSLIAENLQIAYERVFLSVRTYPVAAGRMGCALTAAPYLRLARGAVPPSGVEALRSMSVEQWERQIQNKFLTRIHGEALV